MRQLKIVKTITTRESNSLDKYLKEIGKIELINLEKEVELSKRIKNNDEEALKELVKANLRFVVSIAKQYQFQGLSLPDLINEGNIGMIKAAQKFDETRGFKFISYAVWWIRQSIIQAIAEQSRIVRLPANQISSIDKAWKETELRIQKGEIVTIEKVIEEKGDFHQKHNLGNNFKSTLSLDKKSSKEDLDLIDTLRKTSSEKSTEKGLEEESFLKDIERILKILTKRESDILSMHYGLNGNHPMSLQDIGDKLGLTRERARQIKEKAIRRLKKSKRNEILKKYLG